MIQEFVGFDAYEAACGRDSGLWGFPLSIPPFWLKIALQDVLRAVEDGFLTSAESSTSMGRCC